MFIVKNNTGTEIGGLWVKVNGTSDWGNNHLALNLSNTSSHTFIITQTFTSQDRYDILLGTSSNLYSGNFYLKKNLVITDKAQASFTDTDIYQEGFQIKNEIGNTITGLWIRHSDTDNWGDNLLNLNLLNNEYYSVILSQLLIVHDKYDIVLGTKSVILESELFIKLNQIIFNGSTISFQNNDKGFFIGSVGPAGGVVFYDKGVFSDGWRYLEAAPVSAEFEAEWGAYKYDVSGTTTTIGSGKSNTQIIVNFLESIGEAEQAAQRCMELSVNGFSDWYLPSRDELNLMYQNLFINGLGSFDHNWYWSSSQANNYSGAWLQNFNDGHQHYYHGKNIPNRVCSIRSF